jgi:peptidoglycan-N-acetylglucosamine deacetylase
MGLVNDFYDSVFIAFTAVCLIRWLFLLFSVILDLIKRTRKPLIRKKKGMVLPKVTVIIPAHNEEKVIESAVYSVFLSTYPDFEVIVVDDGSTDSTLAKLQAIRNQFKHLRIIVKKKKGGKASAMNAAIKASKGEYFIPLDADTILDRDTISQFVNHLQDHHVSAVAGNVKVGNRNGLLGLFQNMEYVTTTNIERRVSAFFGCVTTIPGAAGAFRKSAVAAMGYYPKDTLIEDTDLTIALCKNGHRISFAPSAWTFTEAPKNLKALFRQRMRWLHGFIQCIWKYRSSFFKKNALGWLGMPNLFYSNILVFIMSPLYLFFTVILLLSSRFEMVLGGFLIFMFAETIITLTAYILDGDYKREMIILPLQRLFMPVFLFSVFIVVCIRFLFRKSLKWERKIRSGELSPSTKISSRLLRSADTGSRKKKAPGNKKSKIGKE